MATTAGTNTSNLNNQDVLSYLAANEDFFVQHTDILKKLTIPSKQTEGSVSFQDFQIKQLKSQLEKLELRNKRLTQIAIDNAKSQSDINAFSVELIRCKTLETLETTLSNRLKTVFGLDSVKLSLDTNIEGITKTVTLRKSDNNCLHEENGVCIRSEAIIQLSTPDAGIIGHLTLGSMDVQRFHEGQGDELLSYLGGIIGYCLDKLTA